MVPGAPGDIEELTTSNQVMAWYVPTLLPSYQHLVEQN